MTDVRDLPDDPDALTAEELFSLLGSAYTLDVIYEFVIAGDPPLRFTELQSSLDCSTNTLSRRLDELVEIGFLERQSYDEIPPRVEYVPTETLYALEPTFRALAPWIEEHGAGDLGLPDEIRPDRS